MEKWLDSIVEGYSISNYGQIKNKKTGRILKVYLKEGYCRIKINTVKKGYMLHRLVAFAFIPNPKNLPNINHINGIRSDNRADNLEWVTQKENIFHSKNISKNGAVISSQKIKALYNEKLTVNEFYNLLLENCN
jgi:hypothetical protein